MIQFNTTFFIPEDKLDDATAWLVKNYVPELKQRCGAECVVLGRLLTALEDEHVGLALSARFADEAEAEEWDVTVGVSLRKRMSVDMNIPQLLHFSSMIEIIDA